MKFWSVSGLVMDFDMYVVKRMKKMGFNFVGSGSFIIFVYFLAGFDLFDQRRD